MLLGLVLLACLASVPLAGGRLGALGHLHLRATWLPIAAIAVQVGIISVFPGGSAAVHRVAHVASYALVAAFVWANRRLPAIGVIALGGAMNLLAIAANGGVMPADPDAVAAAGLAQADGDFLNSAPVEHPHLLFLGDRFATPSFWPAHNVFSLGDVVLVLGALALLHIVCGSRLGHALRRVLPLTRAALAR